jgi:hypothetical protein
LFHLSANQSRANALLASVGVRSSRILNSIPRYARFPDFQNLLVRLKWY